MGREPLQPHPGMASTRWKLMCLDEANFLLALTALQSADKGMGRKSESE